MRVLVGTAVSLLAIFELIIAVIWLRDGAKSSFNDFFGFWSFGRAAASGIQIYDISALRALQNELASAKHNWYPYFYPPSLLLPLIPLSALPLGIAYVAWSVGGITAYIAATLGRRWRSTAGLSLLLAPTTLLTFVSGHSGLISSALLIGGLRQIEKRPILAGILFGLLTAKPQNGLLVPVVLLAGRYWRVAGTASFVALALVVASGEVFGAAIWLDWLSAGPSNWRLFWVVFFGPVGHLMPTVAASMRQIGASSALADTAQAAVAIGVFFVTWRILQTRHYGTDHTCRAGRNNPCDTIYVHIGPAADDSSSRHGVAAAARSGTERNAARSGGSDDNLCGYLGDAMARTAACRSNFAGTYVRAPINP